MRNKVKGLIVTISTSEKGGIRSVVENYYEAGLFSSYESRWIKSHSNSNALLKIIRFLYALFFVLFYSVRRNTVFHMHMSMNGSFYRKFIYTNIAKLLGSKVILHLHGSEFKTFYLESGKFTKYLIKTLFTQVCVVVALSNTWRDFINRVAPLAIVEVINNFCMPVENKMFSKTESVVKFVFLGAVIHRKGIFDLIEAFAMFKSEYRNHNVKLIVCGDGLLTEAVLLAKELGLEEKIEFLGWIDRDKKTQVLNNANAIVLPSYNEGLPMVIVEALSLGKPVITTPVGGVGEIIIDNENGFLVEPGNILQIRQKLREVLNGKNTLNVKVSANAAATYKAKFSPGKIVPKVDALYKELLRG